MKVRCSSDAEDDRDEIREYIAADNPRAALRLEELLGAAAGRLGRFPFSGRAGVMRGMRELIAHRHYRLVYEVVHRSHQGPPLEDGDA